MDESTYSKSHAKQLFFFAQHLLLETRSDGSTQRQPALQAIFKLSAGRAIRGYKMSADVLPHQNSSATYIESP